MLAPSAPCFASGARESTLFCICRVRSSLPTLRVWQPVCCVCQMHCMWWDHTPVVIITFSPHPPAFIVLLHLFPTSVRWLCPSSLQLSITVDPTCPTLTLHLSFTLTPTLPIHLQSTVTDAETLTSKMKNWRGSEKEDRGRKDRELWAGDRGQLVSWRVRIKKRCVCINTHSHCGRKSPSLFLPGGFNQTLNPLQKGQKTLKVLD